MLSVSTVLSALLLGAAVAVGAIALRRGRERLALGCLALAPLIAVLPFIIRHVPVANAPAQAPPPAPPTAVASPTDPSGLSIRRAEAAALAASHEYARARDAYAALVREQPGDADLWADLADASAGAANGDLETGAQAIERALELNPRHIKALWLKASLELARRRYPQAIALWQQLLALLPPDSEDHKVVEANVREAQGLAGTLR
jgi:tetratricopeptide (TPR) repeat protein